MSGKSYDINITSSYMLSWSKPCSNNLICLPFVQRIINTCSETFPFTTCWSKMLKLKNRHFYVPATAKKDNWSCGPQCGWHLAFSYTWYKTKQTKNEHVKGGASFLVLWHDTWVENLGQYLSRKRKILSDQLISMCHAPLHPIRWDRIISPNPTSSP